MMLLLVLLVTHASATQASNSHTAHTLTNAYTVTPRDRTGRQHGIRLLARPGGEWQAVSRSCPCSVADLGKCPHSTYTMVLVEGPVTQAAGQEREEVPHTGMGPSIQFTP